MRNAGLEETQAGIKIAGRNINNLRYADDTTLMAESEEELKASWWKWKWRVKRLALSSTFRRLRSCKSVKSLSIPCSLKLKHFPSDSRSDLSLNLSSWPPESRSNPFSLLFCPGPSPCLDFSLFSLNKCYSLLISPVLHSRPFRPLSIPLLCMVKGHKVMFP